jgi:hypothetical protein
VARYYSELDLWDGWTMERVNRCCGLMQITLEEAAVLCCCEWHRFKGWLKADKVPSYVALTLHHLEQDFTKAKYG